MLARNINLHKENKKQQTQWHKKKKHKQLAMNRMQNNKEKYFVHEKRKQKQRERETLPQGNEYLASSSYFGEEGETPLYFVVEEDEEAKWESFYFYFVVCLKCVCLPLPRKR